MRSPLLFLLLITGFLLSACGTGYVNQPLPQSWCDTPEGYNQCHWSMSKL